MKKVIFAALLAFAFSGARAQELPPLPKGNPGLNSHQNALKLYPFAFIKSRFAISYERTLQNNWALQAGAGVVSNDQSAFYNATNIFGYSADVQLRKYLEPGKPALAGIYFAPRLGFKYIQLDPGDYYYYSPLPGSGYYPGHFTSTAVQGGLVMGYQLPILKVVVADVYAGGGYRHVFPEYETTPAYANSEIYTLREYTSSGVYPILGLQIGVLF